MGMLGHCNAWVKEALEGLVDGLGWKVPWETFSVNTIRRAYIWKEDYNVLYGYSSLLLLNHGLVSVVLRLCSRVMLTSGMEMSSWLYDFILPSIKLGTQRLTSLIINIKNRYLTEQCHSICWNRVWREILQIQHPKAGIHVDDLSDHRLRLRLNCENK